MFISFPFSRLLYIFLKILSTSSPGRECSRPRLPVFHRSLGVSFSCRDDDRTPTMLLDNRLGCTGKERFINVGFRLEFNVLSFRKTLEQQIV